MAVDSRQSRRFDAPSPVTRYWLANCVGFSLAGGGRGTVERVLTDVDPYDPSLLEIRTGRWRVRPMPAEAVVAVIPADRLLIVDRRLALLPDRRREATLRLRRTAGIVWRGLAVAMTFLGALSAEVWRLSRRAWAVGSPAVARTSRRGGSEAVRFGSEATQSVRTASQRGFVALIALMAESWRRSRRAWAAGSPAVARTSRRGGSEAVRLGGGATRWVRSVPWRSYGRRKASNPSDEGRTTSSH